MSRLGTYDEQYGFVPYPDTPDDANKDDASKNEYETEMQQRLLPCPFCGGKAELRNQNFKSAYVVCTDCHCKTPNVPARCNYNADAIVIHLWNERTEMVGVTKAI